MLQLADALRVHSPGYCLRQEQANITNSSVHSFKSWVLWNQTISLFQCHLCANSTVGTKAGLKSHQVLACKYGVVHIFLSPICFWHLVTLKRNVTNSRVWNCHLHLWDSSGKDPKHPKAEEPISSSHYRLVLSPSTQECWQLHTKAMTHPTSVTHPVTSPITQ